jgi:hypothetical protein
MRKSIAAVVLSLLLALLAAPIAAADPGVGGDGAGGSGSRTFVFRNRVAGLVAEATWTTCPTPALGDVCTDTIVFAFDTKDRSDHERSRTPVLRILTFVYRVVDGDVSDPVAEWFGRLEGAEVDGRPRLEEATAQGLVPIQLCTIFEPESGLTCPESVEVSVTWTGVGSLERLDDHTVRRDRFRMENVWTRGWQRDATAVGTVDGQVPGELISAELFRVDQGELIVQHPVD